MQFRNLFLSLFLVLAVGFALVQAEDPKEPRGPKITHKVICGFSAYQSQC